jgi:hypothetical protein
LIETDPEDRHLLSVYNQVYCFIVWEASYAARYDSFFYCETAIQDVAGKTVKKIAVVPNPKNDWQRWHL